MAQSTRGFGVAGEYPLETIRAVAPAAEAAGYHTFWLSQPENRDSLATLADVSGLTQRIKLGIGAIPFTLRGPDEMAGRVRGLNLPLDRLRLGVGSGTGPGSLDRLRDGVRDLRSLLDVEIVVAPLGPKMCRLAGEVADGVLLNWLTPEFAHSSLQWVQEGADAANRERPLVFTYVRCSLGSDVLPRMQAESARYGSFPHYARHFKRQGLEPIQTTITAQSPAELRERLAAYEAVLDAVVVRSVTVDDSIEQALELVEAARPG
jgi:alkanesulfonate monooxygenase SsuD/methylene tetrahydromethanopterin reductase-like flavin-dependent oxidoreductase (luciferase family)